MSNFKCDKCGTTLIDCGLGVFKTPKEIELERKLEIAEEALQYYANSKMPDDLYTSEKINGSAISTDNWAIRGEFNQYKYKVYYDNENAQQALQKIKEVNKK